MKWQCLVCAEKRNRRQSDQAKHPKIKGSQQKIPNKKEALRITRIKCLLTMCALIIVGHQVLAYSVWAHGQSVWSGCCMVMEGELLQGT